MNIQTNLVDGLNQLDIELEGHQVERLIAYLELLAKWNRSYNLTAITDPQKMLSYHLLDSLSILKWFAHCGRALDVGSGAGLPGIPLAIAAPECHWTLLDSNGKKARFMQQALATCAVSNATVVKSRVEDYHAPESFDMIVSRAYASLGDFVESVAALIEPETILMTMKTGLEDAEAAFDTTLYNKQEYDLQVPGVPEPRKLVTLTAIA
ncbi:MAG: 16S rRNA (guanine(527)-N(7))-methyltransferase RsmG [Gammaproteobacteria bacterium]|nr:16S rRNA (guanine(527)-N(7))-methyltransferase RsmG [Gammaproteobacteria bacterium]